MILDVAMAAVLLVLGIVTFRHFEQRTPLWRRFLKILGVLAMTAIISHYFGRTGVIIAFGVAVLPVIYIHVSNSASLSVGFPRTAPTDGA